MRLALALALLGFAATTYGEGWLCVTDSAAGFRYDKTSDRWTPRTFNLEAKYVLRRANPGEWLHAESAKWVLISHGEKFPVAFCEADFNENGWIKCGGIGVEFTFRSSSLRYMITRSMFVLYTPQEKTEISKHLGVAENNPVDDAGMEIGRCTAL